MGFGVWGFGFDFGFDFGFGVRGLSHGVWGFRVLGLGVWGLGFGV